MIRSKVISVVLEESDPLSNNMKEVIGLPIRSNRVSPYSLRPKKVKSCTTELSVNTRKTFTIISCVSVYP